MDSVSNARTATEANRANYPSFQSELTREEREANRAIYDAESSRIYTQFKTDLIAEEGTGNAVVDEAIFEKAWSDGHASGFGEVHSHFTELTSFAEKILAAAK